MRKISYFLIAAFVLLVSCKTEKPKSLAEIKQYFSTQEFVFEDVAGIGFEKGVTRRDNSDIIKVENKYYVYYTKVFGRSPGYWGSIWAAVSEDEGHSWKELGEVLTLGKKGQWDSQATFTPNILEEKGTYYLYYTGVQPTPTNTDGKFENNSSNDYTAIGVAKANSPEGPFVRCETNPIISVSHNHDDFDSYRVDDAVLLKKDGEFWLYFKGRKYSDGIQGPSHTEMGVAFARSPDGPFEKYVKNPILSKSHEVFLWKQNNGVACLASISTTFEYAADGLDFSSNPISVEIERNKRPNAPGAYRPDLSSTKGENKLSWGISMIHNGADCYLVRWELRDKKVKDNQSVIDSISIGEPFTIYKMPYAYDHSIIYNLDDKKWHLYGIETGNKTFIHLTADSLTQQGWEKHEPFTFKEEEIWAPHIIKHEGLYYMYFTNIGVPREIRLATSRDLFQWEHYSEEALFAWSNEFTDNMKNKDPMVFRDEVNSQWMMYYSMMKDEIHWVLGYSTSTDLVNWSEPKICFDENTVEPGVESPFVVKRGKYYYLFLSARPWPHGAEEVFRSESPFLWQSKDLIKSINPWHAAEVVQDLNGKWYLSRSSGNETDFRLAPLFWNDGRINQDPKP